MYGFIGVKCVVSVRFHTIHKFINIWVVRNQPGDVNVGDLPRIICESLAHSCQHIYSALGIIDVLAVAQGLQQSIDLCPDDCE